MPILPHMGMPPLLHMGMSQPPHMDTSTSPYMGILNLNISTAPPCEHTSGALQFPPPLPSYHACLHGCPFGGIICTHSCTSTAPHGHTQSHLCPAWASPSAYQPPRVLYCPQLPHMGTPLIGGGSMGAIGASSPNSESRGGSAPVDLRPTSATLFISRTITSAPSLV